MDVPFSIQDVSRSPIKINALNHHISTILFSKKMNPIDHGRSFDHLPTYCPPSTTDAMWCWRCVAQSREFVSQHDVDRVNLILIHIRRAELVYRHALAVMTKGCIPIESDLIRLLFYYYKFCTPFNALPLHVFLEILKFTCSYRCDAKIDKWTREWMNDRLDAVTVHSASMWGMFLL